jgi:hypothetical protein
MLSPSAPSTDTSAFTTLQEADAAVVLPTLDEERGLGATLDDIPFSELASVGWKVAPLVLDGGSKDRTIEIARARGVSVVHQRSRGKGAAIREAFDYLRERGVRYAVVLDADHTYPGSAVGPVLALLFSGSHLVVGVRRPADTPFANMRDLVHRLGNGLLNWTAWQVSRRPILDTCSGMYGVDLRALAPLKLESTGFEIEAELFLKAHRNGLAVTQIPIDYRERLGTPKLHAGRDGGRILLAILRYGVRRVPRRARTKAPVSDPSLLRTLLSICFVHGAEEVLLFCPPSRHAEGKLLTARLNESRLASSLVVAPYDRLAHPAVGLPPQETRASATAPMVVALPSEGSAGPGTGANAVALLPRTRRMVYVSEPEVPQLMNDGGGQRSDSLSGPTLRPVPTMPGARLELKKRDHRRRYSNPLRALWMGLDYRSPNRELALLVANAGAGESVTVWRESASRWPRRP